MPVRIPVVQTGLEASIEAAAKKAGRNLKINMGGNAKSIEGLSQPLGRITGKADQFTKSMEAANARVLAFGASVGILSSVTRGFQDLIRVTIDVEKSLTSINSILNVTTKELDSFKNTIFDVAKNTEQSFGVVSQAALELSRQGLKAEEVTKRLNDALVLSRLSGLGASEAVAGLTAAINSFNKSGITSAEVLNKLSAAAVSAAVSERDLIEGIKRSGSVATQAGVSFDELVGVITAVQAKTARGGAVIGNSFKTIFTRIQAIDKLQTMQNLGVEVTDASGQVLSATKLIQNLAKSLEEVPDARRLQISEGLVGKFQVAPFLAILDDYSSKTSQAIKITEVSQNAFSEAYDRNEAQNATLSAAINRTTVSVAQLADALGKIGITDNLKSLLGFFTTVVDEIQGVLDGDGIGSKFAKGILAGIGNIITGPALAVFAAVIGKLVIDLVRFGTGSLKTFFGLNKAAQEQATLQGQIASTLLGNSNIQKKILDIENSTLSVEQKRVAQTAFFTTALNEQVGIMTRMQGIAAKITPGVMAGTRGKGRAAGGFIPNYNAIVGYGSERADISKGVGGAPASAKPVTIPNFNFGGGQKGTMVANSSEYIVPNYAGGDGSAIFNQDMAASIGLPVGARKIGAAGGYIPNFAKTALGSFRGTYNLDKINPSNKAVFFNQDGSPKTDKVKNVLDKHPNSPEAKALMAVRGKIYNANTPQKSVMLIPQEAPFQPSAANHRFQKPYKGFNQFLGGVAGINPALNEKNSKFAKLLKLDSILDDSLADAVNVSLNKAIGQGAGSLKAKPKSYSAKEIKNLVLAEGGAGAFGAMRGAMFEGIMKAITGGVSQGNEGKLDAVFDSNRKVIEEVFGLENQNFEFGDFKNSALSKDKYARQIITNVPKAAAAGYIPNYAGGLQDAIGREKAAGLPINQIRVNQDPKLRNSGNPMGLAITNTRDEPTGAIPNFAKKGSTEGASSAMGDLTTKLFGVQIGLSALSGVLGEITEKNKLVSGSLTLLNVAITAAMASSAFGGVKGIMGGAANLAGTFTGRGAMAARGTSMMSAGRSSKGFSMLAGAGKATIRRGGMAGVGLAARGVRAGGLMAGLKVAGGALVRFAGPIGLAITAVLAFKKIFDFATGTTDNLARNQNRLAESAKNAAKELSELKIEDKEEFKAQNQGIANQFKKRIGDRGFQGFEDKQQTSDLAGLIKNALDAGATNKQIETIIGRGEKASKRTVSTRTGTRTIDGVFSNNTADIMSRELTGLSKRDFSRNQDKFTDSITQKERLILAAGGKDAFALEAKLRKRATDDSQGFGISSDAITGAIKTAKESGTDTQESIDQMRGDEAKLLLKTEIEIAKIKAQALTEDQKALALGQENNSLSGAAIANLQNKIALEKLSVETNSKVLDILSKEIEKNESITLDTEKVKILQDAIAEKGLENLKTPEARKELIEQTLLTLQKEGDEAEAIAKLVESTVSSEIKLGNAQKANLIISQQQTLEAAKRKDIIENISRDLTRQGRSINTRTEFEIGSRKNALQLQRGLSNANPNLTDAEKARRNMAFTAAEGVLDIDESKANAVKDTRTELTNLIDKIPALGESLKILIGTLDKEGFSSLGKVSTMLSFAKDSGLIKLSPKQEDDLANANVGIEGQKKNVQLTGQLADVNNALSEAALKNINAFKAYSVLLSEFTLSLNQSAEQLKLDLLMVKDGAGAISNIDQQLFTAAAKVGGAGATARASDNQALRGATDRITLARTSVERRAAIKNKDILAQELAIKTEVAKKQKDGITDTKELVALRERLVELEKQRLAIGTSRAELFENEFNFTTEEIQEGLDRALVQNARTFVDTISDGLVDAIAKGQDLGDVLKQAASNFFLGEAKSNMSAAFKNITGNLFASGGPVTGGSGSKDDVPALLMGGEFVMKKSAVQKYGSGFMNSLNSGNIPAMARGGLFTPGTYGQGEMKGTRNLLDFATQSFTTGASDKFNSGSGFASIGLEPQSAALTMFGRRNSPAFQREQASKQKAFGLFTRAVEQERAAKERGSGFSEILKKSLLSFGASFAFKELTNLFGNKSPTADITQDFSDPTQYDNGYPFSATGGPIPYAAGVDTIPSMLSGGEFVMNAAATQRIGRGNLNALNSGGGGGSGDVVSKLDELISVSDNSGETVINITVNSDGSSNSEGSGDDQQNSLAMKIKDVVKQVIDDEKRLGGSLRQARA